MEVNVTKRIVTQHWDRYCPVVLNSSGRIKPHWVIVDGNQEKSGLYGLVSARSYGRVFPESIARVRPVCTAFVKTPCPLQSRDRVWPRA